jgi:hypothetical protein
MQSCLIMIMIDAIEEWENEDTSEITMNVLVDRRASASTTAAIPVISNSRRILLKDKKARMKRTVHFEEDIGKLLIFNNLCSTNSRPSSSSRAVFFSQHQSSRNKVDVPPKLPNRLFDVAPKKPQRKLDVNQTNNQNTRTFHSVSRRNEEIDRCRANEITSRGQMRVGS